MMGLSITRAGCRLQTLDRRCGSRAVATSGSEVGVAVAGSTPAARGCGVIVQPAGEVACYDHTMLKTPGPIRSPKLSNIGLD